MKPIIMVVVGMLVLYALVSGMLWAAIGLIFVLAILHLSQNKKSNQKVPMFRSGREMPIEPMGEQNLKVKFMGNWDGHDEDLSLADMTADHTGMGIGRGIGFFR